MANKNLFKSASTSKAVKSRTADTKNRAGGKAYSLSDKSALAQFAVTGTFNGTFYTDEKTQLKQTLELANKVPADFLAKVAIYARKHGFMKDMPAVLVAVLATRDTALFKQTFPKVIDNGKMLRNFVQVMRSGAVGRKSLGSAAKKAVQKWFREQSDSYIFEASVGNSPSLADVIKMVHPRPETKSRSALYAYLTGRKYEADDLPLVVKQFEVFKASDPSERTVPDVPFQMLTAQNLSDAEWTAIAKNGNWHFTRMNLNTFDRHGVFKDKKMVSMVADRIRDPKLVRKARVFPMQLLATYKNTQNIDKKIVGALHDAVDVACENIPEFKDKKVYVAVDSSGSMCAPATGTRKGATSVISCKEAGALIAAAIVRKNEDAEVLEFTESARFVKGINPRDSVFTIESKIGSICGGTSVSSPVALLNSQKAKGDLVIILTDLESWYDAGSWNGGGTKLRKEWDTFLARNPGAQLVCINLQFGATTQAADSKSVLNLGGFSDPMFTVISNFVESGGKSDYWVEQIEKIVTLN